MLYSTEYQPDGLGIAMCWRYHKVRLPEISIVIKQSYGLSQSKKSGRIIRYTGLKPGT
jgi:hypothetical protein